MKVFNSNEYNALNESHVENRTIVEAFLKVGPITMQDGTEHQPSEFVDVVNSALFIFRQKHPWEFKFIQYARIIYLLDSRVTSTMCVDDKGDLYINVEFIYSFLKMNPKYIMYILYHESMHNILSHVKRGIEYGKKAKNKLTWTEMNICADFEVNGQMVADRVCSAEDWEVLHGCYDPQFKGFTFEMIADKKNKIRNVDTELEWNPKLGNGSSNQNKNKPKSPDYQRGYNDMKKAISDLLKANSNDKKKTEAQLTSIYASTKKPKEVLAEIEKLLKNNMQYILDSILFESASSDEEWVEGLKDGFSDGISKLYEMGDSKSIDEMTPEEAADAAQQAAEEAEEAAEEAKRNAESKKESESGNSETESEEGEHEDSVDEEGNGSSKKTSSGESEETEDDGENSGNSKNDKSKNASSDRIDGSEEEPLTSASDAEKNAEKAKKAAEKAKEAAKKAKEAAERGDEETARKEAENARKYAEEAKNARDRNENGEDGSEGEKNGEQQNKGSQDGRDQGESQTDNKSIRKEKTGTEKDGSHGPIKGDMPLTDVSGINSMVGRIVKTSEIEANLEDSLKASGYDSDDINSIRDEIISRPIPSTQSMTTLREQIVMNKKNSVLADLCNQVNVEENVTDELWGELIKKFLERTTTRRGSDNSLEDPKDIRWGNRRYLSMDDIIMPYKGKKSSAPQYINIFIDCSGSINANICFFFLGIIENLCKKLEFSGIRLIPFSDEVEESKIVGCTADELKEQETLDMLHEFIYDCERNYYGGGGNSTSFLCMAKHIAKCDLAEPESVYLVMTDGGLFDTHNIIKFKPFSQRVLFCITDYDIMNTLKNKDSYLSWCVNPKYSFLDKVYIEIGDEE